MTSKLSARLDRLRPLKPNAMVVYREPGDSDADVELKSLAAGRPVVVTPRPCKSAEEWILTYGPIRGAA